LNRLFIICLALYSKKLSKRHYGTSPFLIVQSNISTVNMYDYGAPPTVRWSCSVYRYTV